jgi:hypothetical protein
MPSRKDGPDLYYARRPFGYTDALYVDQGQVVELADAINDEKLTRLGYFELLTPDQRSHLMQCGECGARFLNAHFRDRHGDRQHRNRGRGLEVSPAGAGGYYADDAGEAEERRLEQEAPLYIEKSEASQR